MTTLLIATRNAHKVGEIRAILGGKYQLQTLDDVSDAPSVVEDAGTFAGNAAKKAVVLARWLETKHSTFNIQHSTSNFVLADDSGLEVDALNGAPGVHSARFAAMDSGRPGNSSDADNNAKLLRLLKHVPPEKRAARFHCVLALVAVPAGTIELAPDIPERRESSSPVCYLDEFEPRTFDGVCEGRMIHELRGNNGFGYDPLFVPDGYERTFAELGDDVKNKISHRARALAQLKNYFANS